MRKRAGNRTFLFFVLAILLSACSPAISKQVLREANRSITFQDLQKDPDRYAGQVVVEGGQILSATAREGDTWVEVLQQPLDWRNRPQDTDVSYGRFLARLPGPPDPSLYAVGQKITVAGQVQGKRVQPIGMTQYTYPVLIAKEFYLWRPDSSRPLIHIGIGFEGVIR